MKTTNGMKLVYIFLVLFILILVLFLFLGSKSPESSIFYEQGQVIIGENVFNVDVADTPESRERGLSGKKSLNLDEGMFFIFQKSDNYGFWMKDMLFPLDIIWIGDDFKVNHIEENVSPDTFPKTFYSNVDSVYVLEISSGGVDRFDIKIGDKVIFRKK